MKNNKGTITVKTLIISVIVIALIIWLGKLGIDKLNESIDLSANQNTTNTTKTYTNPLLTTEDTYTLPTQTLDTMTDSIREAQSKF